MIQAEYLGMQFKIDDTVKKTLEKVELSRSLKTEEKETKDGNNQLEIVGYEAQSITIEYPASPALGTYPVMEYLKWVEKLGKKGAFILGKEQFGLDVFMLTAVELSSSAMSNNGRTEYGMIKLSLKQDEILTSAKVTDYQASRQKSSETVKKSGAGTAGIAK